MTCLFDTSALIAYFRAERGGEQMQALLDHGDMAALVASVSLPEFARRLRELGMPPEEAGREAKEFIMALAGAVGIVDIDAAVALDAFELSCAVPGRLPLADSLIAAAARSRGAILVHRDKHMRAIPAEVLAQIDLEAPATA